MAALREILATFGVSFDDKALKKGDKAVDGVAGKLQALSKVASAASAAMSAFLGAGLAEKAFHLIDGIAEQADALGDLSERLGVSTDALQEFGFAAKLSGAESEDLTAAFAKLQNAAGEGADSLRDLGVSVKSAGGQLKTADVLLEDVAEAFEKIDNPTKRTNKAMQLFGRSGAKLVPLLARGKKGIKELRKEFKELGGGFSKETIESAGKYKDSLDRLNTTWTAFKSRLGAAVLPLAEKFVGIATKAATIVNRWADMLKPVIARSNILKGVATALGVALFAAFAPAFIAALPIVAVLGLIAFGIDEILTMAQGGETVLGDFIESIAGPGARASVEHFVRDVVGTMTTFFSDTTKGWNDFKAGIALIWFDLGNWLTSTWIGDTLVKYVKGSFTVMKAIVEGFAHAWVWSFSIVRRAIDGLISGVEKVGSVIEKIPGAKFALDHLTPSGIARDAASLATSPATRDQAAIDRQRQAYMDSTVPSVATATSPAAGARTMTDNSQINITVPPSTTAQQAREIAAAVKEAKAPSTKAMQNSLVRSSG